MNNFFIIDNEPSDTLTIHKVLLGFDKTSKIYPKKDEYDELDKIVRAWISNKADPNIKNTFKELVSKKFPEGVSCFIVDVALASSSATDKSGIEFRKTILKELYQDVPVVLVTQFTENEIKEEKLDGDLAVLKANIGSIDRQKYLELNLPPVIMKALAKSDDKDTATNISTPLSNKSSETTNEDSIKNKNYYEKLIKKWQEEFDERKSKLEADKLRQKIDSLDYKHFYVHTGINFFFILLLFIGSFFLIAYPAYSLYEMWHINKFSAFKLIEDVFIAPLPLIIILTFYNYYQKILRPILIGTNEQTDKRKMQAMLDLSITKYLFASVLFSTIMVSMLDIFSKITPTVPDPNHNRISNILYATDTVNKSKIEYTKHYVDSLMSAKEPLESSPQLLNKTDNMHIYGLALGFLLLLILMFYILKLEKHISEKHK